MALQHDEYWPPVFSLKRGQIRQAVNLHEKGLNCTSHYGFCYYIGYKLPY